MILVDVIALQKENSLPYASGNYKAVAVIPNGDPIPDTTASGYTWIRIAKCVSEDEAHFIISQYPQATRAK